MSQQQVWTQFSLGYKDHNATGNELDASDQDGAINITSHPVHGMYQPDGLAYFKIGGISYFLSANEGAARKYTGYSEDERVANLNLNSGTFSNISDLQSPNNAGRLKVTTAFGDHGGDGIMDTLYSFGGRSFSIWDAETGDLVYDSGSEFESKIELLHPDLFNSEGLAATFDTRSDNKGPEPEDVVIGKVGSRSLAFIGLEQIGGIMVYDITDPTAPTFLLYEPSATNDFGPEASVFINAAQSPTGNPLLIVSHETSSTLAIYEIANNVGIQDASSVDKEYPYPNPSKTTVTIRSSAIAGSEYVLYSIFGTLIESKKFVGSEVQVDISKLPQGTYVVKVNEATYKIQKID